MTKARKTRVAYIESTLKTGSIRAN